MKILFLPSDIGGGFGHLSRCLALATEAKTRGHECVFVLNDRKYQKSIKKEFQTICLVPSCWGILGDKIKAIRAGRKARSQPLFLEISGLDFQVIRDGLVNTGIVERTLLAYLKAVNKFKPDLLIGDTNLLAGLLSRKSGVPIVQIVRYASYPGTSGIIWWKEEPEGLIRPDSAALFNPILEKNGLKPIARAEELLKGDLYLIPSIPTIEPVPQKEDTFHVGGLIMADKDDQPPACLSDIKPEDQVVYVTIGGGASPVGSKLFFSTLIEAFSEKPFQVFVSTGNKFNPEDFPRIPPNIRIYKWLPGRAMIFRASAVVFHGGYGTMMECIRFGKPALVIPFQSEQEGNGRRLEKSGSGLVLKLTGDGYRKVEARWPYGKYSFLVQDKYRLTAESIGSAVDKLISDNRYSLNMRKLQSEMSGYQGALQAMELIEKRWQPFKR